MSNAEKSPDRLIARIKTLRRRHRDLDAQMEAEEMRPSPDRHILRDLRQQRLGLKEAIRVSKTMLSQSGATPPFTTAKEML